MRNIYLACPKCGRNMTIAKISANGYTWKCCCGFVDGEDDWFSFSPEKKPETSSYLKKANKKKRHNRLRGGLRCPKRMNEREKSRNPVKQFG